MAAGATDAHGVAGVGAGAGAAVEAATVADSITYADEMYDSILDCDLFEFDSVRFNENKQREKEMITALVFGLCKTAQRINMAAF